MPRYSVIPSAATIAAMVGTFVFTCQFSLAVATNDRADAGPYALDDLISLALGRNADIIEGQWRIHEARATLKEARAASMLPRLRLESISGLVPDAEGDIFKPPSDTTGLRPLGPFNRTQLEFVQPLFTFGHLQQLRRAASAGVEVEEASLAERRLDLILEIKELYYSVLLAQDLSDLATDLIEELEEKRDEISEDDPDIPLSAPYKLRLALIDLEQRLRHLADELSLARDALAWKTGLTDEEAIQLEDEFLKPLETGALNLDSLVVTARLQRPDWRQLVSGIRAKAALREAARSAYYPQIFLGGGIRYAVAPGRQDQHNPFIVDDFNYFNGGIFLGLRQSFEWGLLGADADRAEAELNQLRAKENTAQEGIHLDVRRAHVRFERTHAGLENTREMRRLSREWLQIARKEYELDPGEVKELISAFETCAVSEQALAQAIFDHNMALAELERAVGTTLTSGTSASR